MSYLNYGGENMTITEAFTLFIRRKKSEGLSNETLYYYNFNIPKFIEFCYDYYDIEDVDELNRDIFEEYKHFLISNKNGKKKTSLQTYSRAVKTFLNWVNHEDFLREDIGKLTLIKSEVPNIVPLSDKEVKLLLDYFDNSELGIRNKLISLLMLDSGLRRGEVVKLKTANINFINQVMLVQGKGNKERLVPFGKETNRYLQIYSKYHNSSNEYFFQDEKGNSITGNTIKMFFQKLKKNGGIPRIYPHLLRHTFATNYILYGGDVEELRILLGHSSIVMTQKYVHLAAQQRILNQRYHSHIDKLLCEYQIVAS